jgi:hypothetical protein
MSIYSQPLGGASAASAGAVTLYTVPGGGGPAIIRALSVHLAPGAHANVALVRSGVATQIYNNLNSTADDFVDQVSTYHVLEPGDEITAYTYTADLTEWTVSGYQFSSP